MNATLPATSTEPTSDQQLMCQFRDGDLAAFNSLYQRHRGGVYRYIQRQTHDEALTDDLFQDVWKRVVDSASNYQPVAQFNTWLYTIAANRIKDHVRHLQVVTKTMTESEDTDAEVSVDSPSDATSAAVYQSQMAIALKLCMKKLPTLQLQSFLLKEEAGMTAAEIAEVTDASLEASKSRLRYAMQALRECLTLWREKQGEY